MVCAWHSESRSASGTRRQSSRSGATVWSWRTARAQLARLAAAPRSLASSRAHQRIEQVFAVATSSSRAHQRIEQAFAVATASSRAHQRIEQGQPGGHIALQGLRKGQLHDPIEAVLSEMESAKTPSTTN